MSTAAEDWGDREWPGHTDRFPIREGRCEGCGIVRPLAKPHKAWICYQCFIEGLKSD